MVLTRKNRKNKRSTKRNKKGGYRMYKLWTRNRVIAFVNALASKGLISNPGSVTEERGLAILAEVANVSVPELQKNVNPIYFGKLYLGLNEIELERGLLKGASASGFMNQMDELRKEMRWANVASFNKINFGTERINKNKSD